MSCADTATQHNSRSSGRITVRQHPKRPGHDAQAASCLCEAFSVLGSKEAADVCRGRGEALDFESEPSDSK